MPTTCARQHDGAERSRRVAAGGPRRASAAPACPAGSTGPPARSGASCGSWSASSAAVELSLPRRPRCDAAASRRDAGRASIVRRDDSPPLASSSTAAGRTSPARANAGWTAARCRARGREPCRTPGCCPRPRRSCRRRSARARATVTVNPALASRTHRRRRRSPRRSRRRPRHQAGSRPDPPTADARPRPARRGSSKCERHRPHPPLRGGPCGVPAHPHGGRARRDHARAAAGGARAAAHAGRRDAPTPGAAVAASAGPATHRRYARRGSGRRRESPTSRYAAGGGPAQQLTPQAA